MFKLVILYYYCICFLYTVYLIRKKRENGLINIVIITFFPIVGLLLVLYFFKKNEHSGSFMAEAITKDEVHENNNEYKKIYESTRLLAWQGLHSAEKLV
jgi:hypothetical protein